MSGRTSTIRDVIKGLQTHFSAAKPPLSLPTETRRLLQCFIEERDERRGDHEEDIRTQDEITQFWAKYVGGDTSKIGAFAGVLRELQPVVASKDQIFEWYKLVAKPIVGTMAFVKPALEDAQEFIASVLIFDEDEENATQRSHASRRICGDLLDIYLERTQMLADDSDPFVAPENAQVARQVESVLVTFGRKMPSALFHALDGLMVRAGTRLQALTLLSAFLQRQVPHLHQVLQTPLIDHLLTCLLNDTSATVLSLALTSLIMLLPHTLASLTSRLPRLFLVYSRLLCWERFSAFSTDEKRGLVTDDRISATDAAHGDIGTDDTWDQCRPREGSIEANPPELKTYFTYLYGLYPLNFMSYIRKPRRFLKQLDFPSVDDFDLDQAVIRSRSDIYRQSHLCHPNFYNLTIEEEFVDPKWSKMDPADVVAECHGLVIEPRFLLHSPGPPPTGKLPDLPRVPLSPLHNNGALSPAASRISVRSGNSWRDTQSTAADPESPILGPHESTEIVPSKSRDNLYTSSVFLADHSLPSAGLSSLLGLQSSRDTLEPSQTNLAYLQREVTLLRSDLNFEKWHKAQYASHIGQLMRKNVKDATVEAETLNLINANRALKQQLEQVRSAREATIKDSNLTRKQANNLEANMTERFNKLKKEQETWAADADELRRLRTEMRTYRDLLSESEARELKTSQELDAMKREMRQLSHLPEQLREAQRKIKQYESRGWDSGRAKREHELLQSEKETLQMWVRRQEQDLERTRRMYTDRIVELKAQIESGEDWTQPSSASPGADSVQRDLNHPREKLIQLKKAHSRLLERYTDLETEYQSVKSQLVRSTGFDDEPFPPNLHDMDTHGMQDASVILGSLSGHAGGLENMNDPGAPYKGTISVSHPTNHRTHRNMYQYSSSAPSTAKSQKTAPGDSFIVHNRTPPLLAEEGSGVVSSTSRGSTSSAVKKDKVTSDSESRIYGRAKFFNGTRSFFSRH